MHIRHPMQRSWMSTTAPVAASRTSASTGHDAEQGGSVHWWQIWGRSIWESAIFSTARRAAAGRTVAVKRREQAASQVLHPMQSVASTFRVGFTCSDLLLRAGS
jgi:hypothetical protein